MPGRLASILLLAAIASPTGGHRLLCWPACSGRVTRGVASRTHCRSGSPAAMMAAGAFAAFPFNGTIMRDNSDFR